jgi:hypothetical protein
MENKIYGPIGQQICGCAAITDDLKNILLEMAVKIEGTETIDE